MLWLFACEPVVEPAECPPDPQFWAPVVEPFTVAGNDLPYTLSGDTEARPDDQVGFVGGGTLIRDLVATRGSTYTGHIGVETGGVAELTVEWLEDTGSVVRLATYNLTSGGADLELSPHTPGRVLRFTLTGDADLVVSDFSLGYDEWSEVEDTGEGTLSLGLLIHIEDHNDFSKDESQWWRQARVAQSLIEVFAAHGVKVTLQPDASFVKGTTVWDEDWFSRMEDLGTGFSAHLHDESEGSTELEAALRDAKRVFGAVGIDVHDVNGGFQLAIWDRFKAVGFRTLTAFKDPDTQAGPPEVSVLPWRPPNGAGTADISEFLTNDAEGPMLYLGGGLDREAAHDRVAEVNRRRLSQLLAHTVSGETNTGYFVTHVDLFGPPGADDATLDDYLDGPDFQSDLAYYDDWLEQDIDPLVNAGRIEWMTVDNLASPWLKREADCAP